MASLYLLIPIALLFAGIAAALFLWAVRSHQFDDLDKEGQRILFEQGAAGTADNSTAPNTPAQPASIQSQAVNGDTIRAADAHSQPQLEPGANTTHNQPTDA